VVYKQQIVVGVVSGIVVVMVWFNMKGYLLNAIQTKPAFLCVVGQVESVEYSEMHLLPEPLFSIPTDNVHMLSINSTSTGRVFLAGKDGCLYEIAYQVR